MDKKSINFYKFFACSISVAFGCLLFGSVKALSVTNDSINFSGTYSGVKNTVGQGITLESPATTGEYFSSVIDLGANVNSIDLFQWTENGIVPGQQNIEFQTRTSATSSSGPITNTSSDSFTDISKLNQLDSSNYQVSGGQIKMGLPILGDGTDGSLTLSSSKNINIESLGSSTDGNDVYADGISYRVSGISGATITTTTNAPGFVVNDKVLLIDLQGTSDDYGSVGNYEVLTVSSVSTNSIFLTSSPTKDYDGSGDSFSNQKVVIQRIPQYTDITINSGGTITASAWEGLTTTPTGNAGFYTGIVAFYANGTITINSGGSIDLTGKGFRGGSTSQGESIIGLGTNSQSASAGGGGGNGLLCGEGHTSGGGGGAYATSGNTGGLEGSCTRGAGGTDTYGSEELTKLYFGAGGGAPYNGTSINKSGGIVFISANTLSNAGTIMADGTGGTGTGNDASGSGAGGSLRIDAINITAGTMSALGGPGFSYFNNQVGNNTGKGGDGRIAIYYVSSLSGSTTPTAYTSQDSAEFPTASSIVSTDFLNGVFNVSSIDSIMYNLSSKPSGTTAAVQFSSDGTNWYNKDKASGSETMTTGSNNTITLSNYSGTTFYYKISFSGDGSATSVLNDITLNYTYLPNNSDSFENSSKINAGSSSNYIISGGQVRLGFPIDWTDGSLTVSSSKNLNTESLGADSDDNGSYADGIAYRVTGISGSTITTSTNAPGLVADDKVLLIDLQGTASDYDSVGNYEVLTVSSVSTNNIYLTSSTNKDYDGSGDSFTNQKVIIQRIPQFTDVTVDNGGTITASAWDGLTTTPTGNAGFYTGIVAFYASGTITVNTGGIIDASGKGFRSGTGSYGGSNNQGESIIGLGATSQSASAGGGGGSGYLCGNSNTSGGGGGSYATSGNLGGMEGSCTRGGAGTFTYGTEQLDKLYFGAGGGSSYGGTSFNPAGGIIFITSNTLSNAGTIQANGTGGTGTGNDASGTGAGGSIKINVVSITTGSMSALGGLGYSYYANQVGNNTGKGGDGRIAIYYITTHSGSTSPTAYTSNSSLTYTISGEVISTDLLSGIDNINTIDSFSYSLSSKPTATTAIIQFSTDGINWYDKNKSLGSETLAIGTNNTILLNNYPYDSIYYKVSFTGDGTNTPVLDDIVLNYSYKGYDWGDWSAAPYLTDPHGSKVLGNPQRFLQYKAIFTTTDADVSPLLSSVTVNYSVTKLWDAMSRLKLGTQSNHQITFWTDYGLTVGTEDTMVLSFDPAGKTYDLSSLTISDIELTDNIYTIRNLDVTPSENTWGVNINMTDDTITFSVPTSGTGGYAALDRIIIKIGTNASGGTNQIINPNSAGIVQEKLTLNNSIGEEGTIEVPIVDSDTVDITGSITNYLEFDIDTATGEVPGTDNTVNCDPSGLGACLTYSGGNPGDNYTVDLGQLTSIVVSKSNNGSVIHSGGDMGIINSIYFDITTNVPQGAVVTVSSANQGLQGIDSSKILSVTDGENILANSGKYGFNLPVASHLSYGTINKNPNCDTSIKYCGPTTGPKTVFTTGGAQVELARVRMDIAAAAAYTNTPGNYTDTLTFIATGTF